MKTKYLSLAIILISVFAAGCVGMRDEVLPVHDDILVYNLPYDLTYLRTVEATENIPGWELEETEMRKGVIRVRNINYSALGDQDQRLITILIDRVDRDHTSVQLGPNSKTVVGGDKVLTTISQFVGREI